MKPVQLINSTEFVSHVVILSNFVVEPYFPTLIKQYFGKDSTTFYIPFEEYQKAEYIIMLENSDLIVVWLSLEYLYTGLYYNAHGQDINEVIASFEKLYADIKNISSAKVIWFLFEDYSLPLYVALGHKYYNYNFADKLNLALYDIIKNQVSFINLKHLIAEVGISNAYNQKGKYRWNAPYSKALIEIAVKEIHKQYLIEKGITKKCIVLDCDNVLWGGILSEDGIENIKLGCFGLGKVYQDFQRFIQELYYNGVILAICSKNDMSDILDVFAKHSEMIIKEKQIACFQVNWENKPNNIKRISEQLNIDYNSIVFVDDSLIEIESVKSMLPGVTTIKFEKTIDYKQFSCFNLKSGTSFTDIEKRNKTYQTNVQRENLKSQFSSFEEYVKELMVKTDIHRIIPIEYSRVSELTQRTNKYTNGKRFTVQEIIDYVNNVGVDFYSVHASDRFSDLGLVGAFAIENNSLVLFSLSCRALGREIEKVMIDFIIKNWDIKKVCFNTTDKNEDLKKILFTYTHSIFVEFN